MERVLGGVATLFGAGFGGVLGGVATLFGGVLERAATLLGGVATLFGGSFGASCHSPLLTDALRLSLWVCHPHPPGGCSTPDPYDTAYRLCCALRALLPRVAWQAAVSSAFAKRRLMAERKREECGFVFCWDYGAGKLQINIEMSDVCGNVKEPSVAGPA